VGGERVAFPCTNGDAGMMSREEIRLHVITLGAYHHGKVGPLLKSISVNPPRDMLAWFFNLSQPERRGG